MRFHCLSTGALIAKGHATVSFAVALATILVLGIFAAVTVMLLREGLPVERLSLSWLAEHESEQAANTAATPRDPSSQLFQFRL